MARVIPARGGVTVTDFWLPVDEGNLHGAWFWPDTPPDPETVGVVIVPSIVHEEQTAAVGLVAMAEHFAATGMPSLLVDLAGTAQGPGTLDDPEVVDRWLDDIRAAVDHARGAGLRNIAVVGVRVGALLAAHALVGDPVDVLVAWAPVLSGRRFVREQKMMQAAATDVALTDRPGITVAGFNLPPALTERLGAMSTAKLEGKPGRQVLLVDSHDRLAALDDAPFGEIEVERVAATEVEAWLFTGDDLFAAPFADIAMVARRLRSSLVAGAPGRAADSTAFDAPELPSVAGDVAQELVVDGVTVRETIVRFGPGLTGILSEPSVGEPDAIAYVAVTTVGPGRIFVDFARREAALGRTTLRFDLAGFGTSRRRARDAWAQFYHRSGRDDIDAAVDLLVARGHRSIGLVGFCAGAWSSLQLATRPEVCSIVAINPQLQVRSRLIRREVWPGQPLHGRVFARLTRMGSRTVYVLDRVERNLPLPSPTFRWIRRWRKAGTDVVLAFNAGDLGLQYLERRGNGPLALGRHRPEVRVYDGLGHLPSGSVRDRMLADIHDAT